jgi:hypothetical protein
MDRGAAVAHDDDRIRYLEGDHVESLDEVDRADLDEFRALLGHPATWAEPGSGLEDSVVAAIAEEAQARVPSAPASQRRLRGRRRRLRPVVALGVVAAAAVVVAVAITVGNGGPAAQRFRMEVAGTALAPGAHGRAILTKTPSGWRIELRATGLPRLAGGRYYEAWLKNAKGMLVPVGTFNDARNVTLWAGVKPVDFPTLTVTRQQANGNPASSGRRVLTGTISASG